MSRDMTANQLTAALLIEIPKCFPQIRVWRSNRIDAMAVGRGGKVRRVKAGVDGQADIMGIIGPSGKMLQIEVKVGKDKLSKQQRAFCKMIVDHGGIYLVAPNVSTALLVLGDWLE
jgi:VRR-NUC domain